VRERAQARREQDKVAEPEFAREPASDKCGARIPPRKSRTMPRRTENVAAGSAAGGAGRARIRQPSLRIRTGSSAVPIHLFADVFLYDRTEHYRTNASRFSQGYSLPLSPRQRMKLDRFRQKMKSLLAGGQPEQPRPKLCPACGTLVGAGASRCHQCGASMTFSVAAASRSLGSILPATSPATYGIL